MVLCTVASVPSGYQCFGIAAGVLAELTVRCLKWTSPFAVSYLVTLAFEPELSLTFQLGGTFHPFITAFHGTRSIHALIRGAIIGQQANEVSPDEVMVPVRLVAHLITPLSLTTTGATHRMYDTQRMYD